MGRGFMGMMLKPRCSCRSGWGKGLLDPPPKKKHTVESVKGQGDFGCVFWLERHCPPWICTMWSDGKLTVVPGSFSVFEGWCAQNYGKTRLGCCTTMRRFTRRSSYAVIWQNIRHPLCLIHPILRTYPQQTFSCFSNLNPRWKDVISQPQRRFRKIR